MKKHLEKLDSIKGIKSAIHKLEKKIIHLQEICKHEKVKKTHYSDEEYPRPSYWTNFHCLICNKHWNEEGSK